MNILVTGLGGTLGGALRAEGEARGWSLRGWDRSACAPDDTARHTSYVDAFAPDAILHAAVPSSGTGRPDEGRLVNIEWTRSLSTIAAALRIPFLYVSTVMVFSDRAKGPFTIDSIPDALHGYGGEKRQGEIAAREANSDATIARIGWQIGDAPRGNNMLSYFADRMRADGVIRANQGFLPATSFLRDTAPALLDLLAAPGLHMVDSNEGWSFLQIATALNVLHGAPWRVEAADDFSQDQRMRDPRVRIPPLSARLATLGPPRANG